MKETAKTIEATTQKRETDASTEKIRGISDALRNDPAETLKKEIAGNSETEIEGPLSEVCRFIEFNLRESLRKEALHILTSPPHVRWTDPTLSIIIWAIVKPNCPGALETFRPLADVDPALVGDILLNKDRGYAVGEDPVDRKIYPWLLATQSSFRQRQFEARFHLHTLLSSAVEYTKEIKHIFSDEGELMKFAEKSMDLFVRYAYVNPEAAKKAIQKIIAAGGDALKNKLSDYLPSAPPFVIEKLLQTSPELIKESLWNSNFIDVIRRMPRLFEKYLKELPELAPLLEKDRKTDKKPQRKLPIPADHGEILSNRSSVLQMTYPNSVKEWLRSVGIEINPKAAVSFGIEVEPDVQGEIDTINELRSVVVTDPESIGILYDFYQKRVDKNPRGGFFQETSGTLHLNVGMGGEEYLHFANNLKTAQETVGAFAIASISMPRTIKAVTSYLGPNAYLSTLGDATLFKKKPQYWGGDQEQTSRFEIKTLEIPAGKEQAARMRETLIAIAYLCQRPERLEQIKITDEMQQLKRDLVLLALEARNEEDILLFLNPRGATPKPDSTKKLIAKLREIKERIESKVRDADDEASKQASLQRLKEVRKALDAVRPTMQLMVRLRTSIGNKRRLYEAKQELLYSMIMQQVRDVKKVGEKTEE